MQYYSFAVGCYDERKCGEIEIIEESGSKIRTASHDTVDIHHKNLYLASRFRYGLIGSVSLRQNFTGSLLLSFAFLTALSIKDYYIGIPFQS